VDTAVNSDLDTGELPTADLTSSEPSSVSQDD